MRTRALGAIAMVFAALLAVSVSVPARAVTPDAAGAILQTTARTERSQSLTANAAETIAVQRDGYTVVEAPEPTPVVYSQAASTGADAGQLTSQGWALPVSGSRISSSFGPRPDQPVGGVSDFHSGTDIVAGCGQPVYAAKVGTVIEASYSGSYGNWVLIDHGDGVQTGYAHNSELIVSKGQKVAAGEKISLVGSTGASTGCHLHFEVRIDGTRVNPVPFMSARGITLG